MSSIGATSTPRWANTCQSNFAFWRDLEHAGVFEQRLQQRDRFGLGNLARREPAAAEQIAVAVAMADRDVAGLARRDGERNADEIGLHRIERSCLGVERDDAGFVRARDPALRARRASSTVAIGR